MAIVQPAQADTLEFADPGRRARIIFVVAGDHITPMPAKHAAKRRGMRAQLLDAAVDHITGNHDQISVQRIDAVDNGLDVVALDRWPDVNVAELNNAEPRQRLRQPGQRNIHLDDASHSPRIDITHQRKQAGQTEDGNRGRLGQRRRISDQPDDVAQHSQHQHRRKQPHRQTAQPTEPVSQRLTRNEKAPKQPQRH